MSNYLVTYSRDGDPYDVAEEEFESLDSALAYIKMLKKEHKVHTNISLYQSVYEFVNYEKYVI